MYEQAEPVRSLFSNPGSRQAGEPPPQLPPVHQGGSHGRDRHGNGASDKLQEEKEASSHTYEEAEVVKRRATAGRAYPGGASGRRALCSFIRSHRSCIAAGIALFISLGLAPLTFTNKEETFQLSIIVGALKRGQDDMSTTVDALKRDQDDLRQLFTTVDALKRDQDNMSTTVHVLKSDLDKERSRTAALEQRLYGKQPIIRLVGGTSDYEGRVEVFHGGLWGTVCDDNFGLNDANVVCRQLGHGSAIAARGKAAFGQGSGRIWLADLACD
ncbi:uncharacterized protein, partial [Branchiostoma lanceolatum]|uniref:uncharacterized protein n=1 Tax=Branchiostoma lanceolatum TaxID=7740 RepID=UPI003454B4EA